MIDPDECSTSCSLLRHITVVYTLCDMRLCPQIICIRRRSIAGTVLAMCAGLSWH